MRLSDIAFKDRSIRSVALGLTESASQMPTLDLGVEVAGKFKNHTGIGSSEYRGFGKNARQVGFDRIVRGINKNKLGTFAVGGLCVEVT